MRGVSAWLYRFCLEYCGPHAPFLHQVTRTVHRFDRVVSLSYVSLLRLIEICDKNKSDIFIDDLNCHSHPLHYKVKCYNTECHWSTLFCTVYIETVKGNNSDLVIPLLKYINNKMRKHFMQMKKKILQWLHALIIKLEKWKIANFIGPFKYNIQWHTFENVKWFNQRIRLISKQIINFYVLL